MINLISALKRGIRKRRHAAYIKRINEALKDPAFARKVDKIILLDNINQRHELHWFWGLCE
jgi:hypothetical protein